MKKTIFLSAFVLAVVSTVVYSQSSPETNSRIRDKTATTQANVSAMGSTQPATNTGLNTVAGCYYATGATWYQWSGALANSDAVNPATTRAPYVLGLGMYYDGTNWKRITGETYDESLATTNAPVGIALNAYWDGTASARWAGEAIDDSMTEAPVAPWVAAYGVYRNLDGGPVGSQRMTGEGWDSTMSASPVNLNTNAYGVFYDNGTNRGVYWVGEPLDSDLAATGPTAPFVGAYTLFWNGSKLARWPGEAYDSAMTAAPVNPNVNSFTSFYNGAASQYWQGSVLSSETTANTTYAPHAKDMLHAYDATSGSWRWVNVVDAQADGQASTLNGMVTSSINYAYNGSTFDMMRVGASNELQTTDVATRPGEDAANDWRKVKKEQTAVYTPAATTGTAVTAGTSPVVVLAAIEVLSDINWCVYLKNTDGGADAFTDAFIDTSPNNSDWVTLTWTDCDSLAAGATCVYCVSNNAYRYIRARVSSAADLTVSAWYVSNKG